METINPKKVSSISFERSVKLGFVQSNVLMGGLGALFLLNTGHYISGILFVGIFLLALRVWGRDYNYAIIGVDSKTPKK